MSSKFEAKWMYAVLLIYSSRVLSILAAYPLFKLSVLLSSSVRAFQRRAYTLEISAWIAQMFLHFKLQKLNTIEILVKGSKALWYYVIIQLQFLIQTAESPTKNLGLALMAGLALTHRDLHCSKVRGQAQWWVCQQQALLISRIPIVQAYVTTCSDQVEGTKCTIMLYQLCRLELILLKGLYKSVLGMIFLTFFIYFF